MNSRIYGDFVEYPCINSKEKDWLKHNGISYTFVKVYDDVTVWKFKKTEKLFKLLSIYYKQN